MSNIYTLIVSLCMLFSAGLPAQEARLKSMKIASQQLSLNIAYVYEKAPKPTGRTVLLLHGKNFSHTYWQQTMNALLEKGYDVVAPDQVGFGQSTKPVSYQFSFQQLADHTKRLLDSLKIGKVTVIGHSMGGMLATRFALMYPETCEHLILENPLGLEDWKTMAPYSTIDEEFSKERKKTREQLKDYFIKNYFHGEWKDEYDPVLNETASLSGSADSLAYAKCMALTSDMIFTQPVCYEFKYLKMPVSLIIGLADKTAIGKDRAGERMAARMGNYAVLGKRTAELIPGCKLIELEGIGHIPHMEDFGTFINALGQDLDQFYQKR